MVEAGRAWACCCCRDAPTAPSARGDAGRRGGSGVEGDGHGRAILHKTSRVSGYPAQKVRELLRRPLRSHRRLLRRAAPPWRGRNATVRFSAGRIHRLRDVVDGAPARPMPARPDAADGDRGPAGHRERAAPRCAPPAQRAAPRLGSCARRAPQAAISVGWNGSGSSGPSLRHQRNSPAACRHEFSTATASWSTLGGPRTRRVRAGAPRRRRSRGRHRASRSGWRRRARPRSRTARGAPPLRRGRPRGAGRSSRGRQGLDAERAGEGGEREPEPIAGGQRRLPRGRSQGRLRRRWPVRRRLQFRAARPGAAGTRSRRAAAQSLDQRLRPDVLVHVDAGR